MIQTKQSQHFDMTPLITALQEYIDWLNYGDNEAAKTAWMKVGKAQRDVPAHIAHEYCRSDQPFVHWPSFEEEHLPRFLTFKDYLTEHTWFPLASSTSGLGFDFTLVRMPGEARSSVSIGPGWSSAILDLVAIRRLDEVRIADLDQSRENLRRPASQLGLRR